MNNGLWSMFTKHFKNQGWPLNLPFATALHTFHKDYKLALQGFKPPHNIQTRFCLHTMSSLSIQPYLWKGYSNPTESLKIATYFDSTCFMCCFHCGYYCQDERMDLILQACFYGRYQMPTWGNMATTGIKTCHQFSLQSARHALPFPAAKPFPGKQGICLTLPKVSQDPGSKICPLWLPAIKLYWNYFWATHHIFAQLAGSK